MSRIQLEHLNFTYEGSHTPVFEDLNLSIDTGWKLGLVGRNGRGKTTLLRLLAGEEEYGGRISAPLRCLKFPCRVDRPDATAAQVLAETAQEAESWRLERELSLLGLDAEVLERRFSTLSGGEQNRILLAAMFLEENCYPMLDEPTDHLDCAGRALIAEYLSRTNRGFLLVSHDRTFLDQCVDHILSLNRTSQEIVKGNFSTWYIEKERQDRREQAEHDKLRGEISQLNRAAEEKKRQADLAEKSKMGALPKGVEKNIGRRSYLGEKSRKMQQQRKNLQRRQERAIAEKSALLKDIERIDALKLTTAVYHSRRLLEVKDVTVNYGQRDVCRDISFAIEQGDRICLEGGNGTGKTSLFRMILGENVPHTGEVRRAAGLQISYVSQQVDDLGGSLGDFARKAGVDSTRFMTVLRKLDFPREAFQEDISRYSTGQKKKVLLSASLCHTAHLYIWDEPLNFVDVFSRIQIEELILKYQPTLLFAEHDQAFRKQIATKTVKL